MAGNATRERLIAESMRLFGERGYAGTSVADIEAAAGLSSGAGSLYRHFPSKQALLAAGVRQQIDAGQHLLRLLADADDGAAIPLRERLIAVATAGLRRLEQEADLNRIMLKDLAHFPELLDLARREEVARVHQAVAAWLDAQLGARSDGQAGTGRRDTEGIAAVLVGAVSNFWMLRDIFGEHPAGISEERYLASLVDALMPSLPGVEKTLEN
ncbi:TetR/AcrR family transcriptional regulator [Leifsonia bigeumensis]|uniref:TetR/AcrR family transcriptional regulator n=2 Tax=Leifsonella bigeumensis TaxID=433643 RepID=A0ABP7FJA4_9MICO